MDCPRVVPRARPLAVTSPGPSLPPYSAVVGVLLRLCVYIIVVLYR